MQTTQQVLQSTTDLLERAKREGITDKGVLVRTPQQVQSVLSSPFPTSADQIKNTGGDFTLPKIDTTTPDLSGVSGMISFYQKQYEITQKQQEDYKKQLETTQKKQETETQSWLDKIKGALSPKEERTQALEETGFKVPEYFAERQADISELETLNKEYNNVVAQKDQQIANVMGRPGQSIDFLNNQITQIERNSSVKLNQMAANINSKAAIVEAKQGRYNEAMNYVNQAVENATADLKYNYDMFKAFYDLNQDKIEALDTKLQDAYKDSVNATLNAWKISVSEKEQVGKLMMDNSGAGITINDTLAGAQEKVMKWKQSPAYLKYIASVEAAERAPEKTETNEDFNSDLAAISTYGSRDIALTNLNNLKTALVNKYGIDKYQQLLNEVDRLYPEIPQKQPKPVSSKTGFEVGKTTKGIMKELFVGEGSQQLIGKPIVETSRAIGSFFKGLFSR